MCLACGLCCDGGLYDNVRLDEEDRVRLAEHGIATQDRLLHPCPHFVDQSCSIYEIRPWRCSDYQCQVLQQMLNGEMDAESAHALVDKAKGLRAELGSALPEGLTIARLTDEVKRGKEDDRSPARILAMVRFVAYRMFVERHFLPAKARWMIRERA